MNLKVIFLLLLLFLSACASTRCDSDNHPVRDFCVETVCTSLENSGEHYQRRQQGFFMDAPVAISH